MIGATVGSVTATEDEVTADLIAELLREQHPDLADLPLTFGARGWDNQLWRLGDDLAVRLPWATQGADELLLKEHTLLPAIARWCALMYSTACIISGGAPLLAASSVIWLSAGVTAMRILAYGAMRCAAITSSSTSGAQPLHEA
jgi:hypothetical protein